MCCVCPLNFVFEKAFRLEIWNLVEFQVGLDRSKLLKFQFSANRVNIHVACLDPEIW